MTLVRDVVCGMDIQAETAADSAVYKDNTFYFCSSDCKRQFEQEPEHHLEPYRDWNDPDLPLFLPVAAVPAAAAGATQPLRPV